VITDAAGQALERYFYLPEWALQITDAAGNQTRTSSRYEWRYLYGGGRQDGASIYRIGTGEWDYLTGGPLEHDPQAYWGQKLAYTPPSLSTFDKVALVAAAPVAILAATAVTGPVGGYLAAVRIMGFIGGYNRFAEGQSAGQVAVGALSDGTGWTLLYGAHKNRDPVTGRDLGWSTSKCQIRTCRGTSRSRA
jgi:hypothetical protein